MKLKIRKGATVQVIAGKDKGKKGSVLEVLPLKMKIRVQGVQMQTHFDKENGISEKEGLLDYSNVKLLEGPAAKAKARTKASKKA
ncbi:MAG: 50S ribosomal protein L24 [Bdellovibrionales bacterium]|nr:50S ribosomal protein L24 [Bdellovibrionales bacterium]